MKTDLPGEAAFGWGWVGRSRLLLIDTSQQAATEVLAIDDVATGADTMPTCGGVAGSILGARA